MPEHLCLNLGESFKSESTCLNIPIRNCIDPITNLSLKVDNISNTKNASYKGVGKRLSVSVAAADLKSNVSTKFKKPISAGSFHGSMCEDFDFVWTSIGAFSSNGNCSICSSASKKLIANLDTNPPSDEDASFLCQIFLLMLLKPCWEWTDNLLQDIVWDFMLLKFNFLGNFAI